MSSSLSIDCILHIVKDLIIEHNCFTVFHPEAKFRRDDTLSFNELSIKITKYGLLHWANYIIDYWRKAKILRLYCT